MGAQPRISAVKRYVEPGEVLLSVTLHNDGDARLDRGVLVCTVLRPGHDDSTSTTINSTQLGPDQYIKLFVSLPEGAREGRDFRYVQDDDAAFEVEGIVRRRLLGWAIV